jgi:hypothetical protein
MTSALFVCVHNAGRSQMAAAFLEHVSGGRIEVRSAGSAPPTRSTPLWWLDWQLDDPAGREIAAVRPHP